LSCGAFGELAVLRACALACFREAVSHLSARVVCVGVGLATKI